MREARLLSVQVGKPQVYSVDGKEWISAIAKQTVEGPVFLGKLHLQGDDQADRKHHGGPDKVCWPTLPPTMRCGEDNRICQGSAPVALGKISRYPIKMKIGFASGISIKWEKLGFRYPNPGSPVGSWIGAGE